VTRCYVVKEVIKSILIIHVILQFLCDNYAVGRLGLLQETIEAQVAMDQIPTETGSKQFYDCFSTAIVPD